MISTDSVTLIKAGTVIPAGTSNGNAQRNPCFAGIKVYLKITAKTGTNPTFNFKLQEHDPASDTYTDISGASFAQQVAEGNTLTLAIHPLLTAVANVVVKDVLPNGWRYVITVGGTASPTFTASVGYCYLP